ncbi:MAG: PKD domain-containing protein, partial [Bacteroidia bacterium]
MQTISNSKRTPVFCYLIIFLFLLVLPTKAQYRFQSFFDPDSLKGFNESQAKADAAANNCFGKEFKNFMAREKRDYINKKYQLPVGNNATFKQMLPSNQIMAGCTNMDFEAANTSGWTLSYGYNTNSNSMAGCCPNSGAASCIATSGSDPLTGVSLASPLGGNFVCRINDVYNTGQYTERISQTFNVTSANCIIEFAYLSILEAAGHGCQDQPYMNISLRNCNNQLLQCPQVDIQAGCQASAGFVNAGSYFYTNAWQVGALDLTPYIGSCITIQVTAGACTQGAHWGYGYFDAKCLPMDITVNNVAFPTGTSPTTVSLCGSGTATISAPPGLAPYTWNGPAGSGVTNVTSQSFTTITQGQYSLTMNPPGVCAPINRIVNFSISLPPIAGFNFTTTPCVAGVNVVSTSSLNGGGALTGYSWSWGDGSPNSTTDPASHTYTAGGTSQIKLVVTNAGGCKDSIIQSVNITVPPVIDFTTAPVCMGAATSFSNLSTDGGAPVNSYTWNFGGGGGSSNAVNPSVNFATAGVYTVSLYGENADACPGTTVKSITVFPQPVVSFSANPVCFGSTTTFANTSSVAAPSTINNWYWDFTDDNITDNTTQSPTFVYPTSGTYTVYLKALTNGGCMDSALVNITVNPTPTVNFATLNACKKYNIVLNNTSAVNAPSSMSSYTWNFGSGTGSSMLSSNAATPSNLTYSVPGVKTITLTGVTNNGCVGTITQTVDVYASPTASFNSTSVCFGANTTFTDMSGPLAPSTGSVTSWAWDYDNNGTVDNSSQTATNSYPSSGTYTVSLIVTSANGCMDTIRKTVSVYG